MSASSLDIAWIKATKLQSNSDLIALKYHEWSKLFSCGTESEGDFLLVSLREGGFKTTVGKQEAWTKITDQCGIALLF